MQTRDKSDPKRTVQVYRWTKQAQSKHRAMLPFSTKKLSVPRRSSPLLVRGGFRLRFVSGHDAAHRYGILGWLADSEERKCPVDFVLVSVCSSLIPTRARLEASSQHPLPNFGQPWDSQRVVERDLESTKFQREKVVALPPYRPAPPPFVRKPLRTCPFS